MVAKGIVQIKGYVGLEGSNCFIGFNRPSWSVFTKRRTIVCFVLVMALGLMLF